MNIGIDIDGVLTNLYNFILNEGLKYCKEQNKGFLVNPKTYRTFDMFGWDEETDNDFWIKNIFSYAKNNPPIEGASENIQKLKEKGFKIYIITSRWLANPSNNNIEQREKMRNTIITWLNENNIYYDEIIFADSDKSQYIIDNNIDVMIEDSPTNIRILSKLTKVICMDAPYNTELEGNNIYRCYNWNDIYLKINEVLKNL